MASDPGVVLLGAGPEVAGQAPELRQLAARLGESPRLQLKYAFSHTSRVAPLGLRLGPFKRRAGLAPPGAGVTTGANSSVSLACSYLDDGKHKLHRAAQPQTDPDIF